MRKLDDDFSLFPHLKALFRLHPRLSWECLHYLEADTPQTLLEAKKYFAAPAYLAFFRQESQSRTLTELESAIMCGRSTLPSQQMYVNMCNSH